MQYISLMLFCDSFEVLKIILIGMLSVIWNMYEDFIPIRENVCYFKHFIVLTAGFYFVFNLQNNNDMFCKCLPMQ